VKFVDRLIGSLVVGALAVTVLARELPKLIPFIAVITVAGVIGRLVWYWTQRW
jgi:uncharacterized membrane protein YccC